MIHVYGWGVGTPDQVVSSWVYWLEAWTHEHIIHRHENHKSMIIGFQYLSVAMSGRLFHNTEHVLHIFLCWNMSYYVTFVTKHTFVHLYIDIQYICIMKSGLLSEVDKYCIYSNRISVKLHKTYSILIVSGHAEIPRIKINLYEAHSVDWWLTVSSYAYFIAQK